MPFAPEDPVRCDHADRCGGCPLIGLTYADQLIGKEKRVSAALARYPALSDVRVEAVEPASLIVGYRTRAKLIVGAPPSAGAGKPAALGLFAQGGGHQVVDIPGCRVLAPSLVRAAAFLRERIEAARAAGSPMAPYEEGGPGRLRAVDLREVLVEDAHILATFVMQASPVSDLDSLRAAAIDLMRGCPEVVGVAANFHEGDAPQVLGDHTVPLHGVTSAPDRVGRTVHLASFGSFVQAHRGQAERVHARLAREVALAREDGLPSATGGPIRVLDLFGGSGAIALGLAAAGARVTLVESFAPAVEQARAAARAQRLEVDAICGDVTREVARMTDRGERFDVVVVNPPRRGTSPAAREALARLGARVVAYVSCDPDTLARDLDHLAHLGYAAAALHPLDMIPLTDEVETVAVLRRGEAPPPRGVWADGTAVIVDKAAHQRVPAARRASAGELVAVQVPADGVSGLAVLARRGEDVAKWQQALSTPQARVTFVAAVRGVMPAKGVIASGRDRARTRYRRLAIVSGHSLLRVVPGGVPGEACDARVLRDLAFVGHPVLGDHRHGHVPTNRYFEEKAGLDRPFLHSHALECAHPDTGEAVAAVAPLAGDLRGVLERLDGAAVLARLTGGAESAVRPGARTAGQRTARRAPPEEG